LIRNKLCETAVQEPAGKYLESIHIAKTISFIDCTCTNPKTTIQNFHTGRDFPTLLLL